MGQSWFSGRRRNDYYYGPTTHIPTAPPAAPAGPTASDVPPPFRDSSSPPPTPPPPPPPPPPAPTFYTSSYYPYHYYSHHQCSPYPTARPPPSFSPYYQHAPSSWWPQQHVAPNYPSSSAHTPPPYVEHQQAKTVKNDVNVRKETIRLEVDEQFPDQHLVSFTFDAAVDGSITIFYFAKEGKYCSFSSIYPELCKPVRIPFQKGPGQKFCQPPGSSIDLGFFEMDDLSNPVNDVFPLVIYAEAGQQQAVDEQQEQAVDHRAQITLAVIERKGDGPFQVKIIKQILWIDGQRYELQEIFGLGSSMETKVDEEDAGKECVICMSEPRDTAVLPCRHMCMCSECAKALRLQTNKCPICRQPVKELMEIKIKSGDQ